METKPKENLTDMYLNMIFPFCIIYFCILIFSNIDHSEANIFNVGYMSILTIVIIGFLYGVLAIIRELKEYGKLKTLYYFFKKKNDEKDKAK